MDNLNLLCFQIWNNNLLIWIILTGAVVSQPTISPSGTVDVIQGRNLTLNCTYASAPTSSHVIAWEKRKPGGFVFTSHLSVLKDPGSTCAYFGGDRTVYGYSCPADNQFNIIIYNVQIGSSQGSTWRCSHQVGSAPFVSSTNVTLNVQVPITHVEMVSPASNIVFIKENDSISFECVTSSGKPLAVIKWYKDNRTPGNYMDDVEMSYSSVKWLPDNVTKSILNYTAKRVDDDMNMYCTGNNTGETLTSNRHAQLIIAAFPEVASAIAVSEIAARSVRVSWNYLLTGRMFQQFIVELNKGDGEWIEQAVSTAFFNLSSSAVYSDLTMLKESTRYRIRVYAENVLGRSGPSNIVSFTTLAVDVSGPDLPNTSSQSFSVGAISGGVIGGVILGLLLGILGSWIDVIRGKETNSREYQSGSDDAYSSLQPNPADRNQRVNPSQHAQDGSRLTSEPLSGSDDAYSSISPNPEERTHRLNPSQHDGSRIASAHLSGYDDAFSSIPPNPAERNQRVTQSQPAKSHGQVQDIHLPTGAAYENVVADANAKQETQPGDLTTTAMYESLTHDHRGKEEYEMIKPSHK